jgi:hypothetical protein
MPGHRHDAAAIAARAQVIDDPAIVLVFLSVLFALAMGWASLRSADEQPVNHPGKSAADS